MLKKLTANSKEMKERRANDIVGRCMVICIGYCDYYTEYELTHTNNHDGYYYNI